MLVDLRLMFGGSALDFSLDFRWMFVGFSLDIRWMFDRYMFDTFSIFCLMDVRRLPGIGGC